MLPLHEIPALVSHYSQAYSDLMSDGNHLHFSRYLSGLLICENKTVSGINQSFVLESRDQSSLNRFLTQSRYEVSDLNSRRLSELQAHSQTRMKGAGKDRGVLSLDDTLLSHVGQHFDQISKLWDHSAQRYVYAHNLVNLYYSDHEVEYPINFELWQPADSAAIEAGLLDLGVPLQASRFRLKEDDPAKWQKYLLGVCKRRVAQYPAIAQLYRNKIRIGMDLLSHFCETYPELDLPITFDRWFTVPQLCNYIDQVLNRTYIGALNISKTTLIRAGKHEQPLAEFIQEIKQSELSGKRPCFQWTEIQYKGKKHTTYCYCKNHRLKNFGKVRLLIAFQKEDLSDEPRAYICNQLNWRPPTISRIYHYRWPIETFHQEAKAEGLDKYQVRDFQAIKKHIACVFIAFSILTLARKDPEILGKLHIQADATEQSLAFWRRLINAQALIALIQWVKLALENGASVEAIIQPLMKAYT